MSIDEPRHDPLSGGVDNLHIVPVFKLYIAGEASRAFDTITLDHDGLIPCRRIPSAIDQRAVGNYDGLFTMSAHANLLLCVSGSRRFSAVSLMHLCALYHASARDRNEKDSGNAEA
jgi:hypothetical protein